MMIGGNHLHVSERGGATSAKTTMSKLLCTVAGGTLTVSRK